MQEMRKITFGIIGTGRIGRLHAEHLAVHIPEARVLAVADVNLDAAKKAACEYEIPLAVQDYRELLDQKDIDAVVIASATHTHSQIIRDAACAGKQIFCEKPIDLDLSRVLQVLKVIEENGVTFQVGFNRRFDPSFQKAKELIQAGKIGEPHLIRITSRDPAPPPLDYLKASGGIFLDMTIHDFDMTRFLLDREATEIMAMGCVRINPEIKKIGDIDTCLINMHLQNDILASIDNSRRAVYGYDQRVEIFGSDGMISVANAKPDTHVYINQEGEHTARPHYFFVERYKEAYVAELKSFIDCLLHHHAPPVNGRDGLMALVMGMAAQKSFKEHRPVALNEIYPAAEFER